MWSPRQLTRSLSLSLSHSLTFSRCARRALCCASHRLFVSMSSPPPPPMFSAPDDDERVSSVRATVRHRCATACCRSELRLVESRSLTLQANAHFHTHTHRLPNTKPPTLLRRAQQTKPYSWSGRRFGWWLSPSSWLLEKRSHDCAPVQIVQERSGWYWWLCVCDDCDGDEGSLPQPHASGATPDATRQR